MTLPLSDGIAFSEPTLDSASKEDRVELKHPSFSIYEYLLMALDRTIKSSI